MYRLPWKWLPISHAPDFNFMHYTTENGLPSNCVRDVVQDSDGFMWFATDGGVVRFDGISTKVFTPGGDNRKEGEVFVMSLCRYGDSVLVGTDRHLYIYDKTKENLYEFPKKYSTGIKEKVEGTIHDIRVDSNRNVWAAVEGKGVFRISADGEVTGKYDFPEVNNYIGMIYVDGNDTVWCVSSVGDRGVYKYDRNKSCFNPFEITVDGKEFYAGGVTITSDGNGDYWLGTWERGLVRFNGRTGEGKVLTGLDPAVSAWHIHSIAHYSPTQLLVGSDSGLTLVDTTTGESKVYKNDELNPQSLNDRFVYQIHQDSDGGIWIGTYYRG